MKNSMFKVKFFMLKKFYRFFSFSFISLFLLFFLLLPLKACNTKNFNTAYQDYYNNQRAYISAILDQNKAKEINTLKELIKCGKYLHFNVDDYKSKLNILLQTSKKASSKKPVHNFKTKLSTRTFCKKIKILSFNPLKIRTDKNYRVFKLNTKKLYKKVIDIKYAILPQRFITKKIKNVYLKIAQFNKKTVRIVYYSKKPINLFIEKQKNYLIFSLNIPKKISLSKTPKTVPLFKKRKIIVIDPGHGGKDSGGIGIGGREEKIAVLHIAKYVAYYLKKEGYIVYLTRTKDIFRPLQWRTHFANEKHADLFISIHCNISPNHIKYPHGVETYFLSPARSQRAIRVARLENKEIKGLNYLDQRVILGFLNKDRIISSDKFAIDVQSNILRELRKHYKNVVDGGVRPAPFWVLVGTQMPAILIETGFLTNPMEARRLFNPNYQKLLAKGIVDGINAYFIKNSK